MKKIRATVEVEFLVDDDVTIDQLEMEELETCHSNGMVAFELRFGKSEKAGWSVYDTTQGVGTTLIKFEEIATDLISYKIPKE